MAFLGLYFFSTHFNAGCQCISENGVKYQSNIQCIIYLLLILKCYDMLFKRPILDFRHGSIYVLLEAVGEKQGVKKTM